MLILGLVASVLVCSLYFVFLNLTVQNINGVDKEDSKLSAQRFLANLNIRMEGLNTTANDWGPWDDTYYFVQDNNTAYQQANLIDQTFSDLNLNLMMFINEKNELVYSKSYDLINQSATTISGSAVDKILNSGFITAKGLEQNSCGFILMQGIPMMIISAPIVPSNHEGPADGIIVIGQYLDKLMLDSIAQATGMPISEMNWVQPQMPKDFQVACESFSSDKPIFTNSLNDTCIPSYVLLNDVSGNPIAVVRIDSERTAYLQAKTNMVYAGISYIIIGIFFFATSAVLMDKIVLARLSRLNNTVIKITKSDDHSKRVVVDHSHDELANLSTNINGMIDVIEKSRKELKEYATTLERKVEDRTKELRESQETTKSILQASPDAIIALNNNGLIIESNEQMHKIFGDNQNDLMGKTVTDFVTNEDLTKVNSEIIKVMQGTVEISRFECISIRKDGSKFPAELSANAVHGSQGKIVGLVVIVRDLTERKMIEDRLFKSERLAAIGELAGMVGHDLRNPLSGIKNAHYFLKKKGNTISQEQSNQMMDTIDRCIEHSNKIVNDLLDYSREIHLDLQESSPRTLISEALMMIQVPSIIKIQNNAVDNLQINVDTGKIERVFINLIKNAIDAMPKGGSVTIESKKKNKEVEISFADTGLGIPEEALAKLFSPLFTTKAQGMGFGLAICKRIVEAHKGTITVETAKNVGTTFNVTLPIENK
jgi:PAS domain S-box-containing protein